MTKHEDRRLRLLELAREQGGFFTAGQADEIGFDNANQHRFAKDGRWTRVRRGIFRLASEPEGEWSDFHILALLFRFRDGRPSGIFGLETAAVIHQIGDFMPSRISILVGLGFRKHAKIPENVEIIYSADISHGVDRVDGLFVTSPLRTIVDLLSASDRDKEETRRAFVAARRAGIISKSRLKDLSGLAEPNIATIILSWEHNDVSGEST